MGESNIFPGAILFAVESWVHTLTSFEILYNKHNPHNNTGKRWFNKTILIFFRRLVHSELYQMNWTKYLWKTTFPTLFVLFFGFVHLENNTFSLKSSFVSCPFFCLSHQYFLPFFALFCLSSYSSLPPHSTAASASFSVAVVSRSAASSFQSLQLLVLLQPSLVSAALNLEIQPRAVWTWRMACCCNLKMTASCKNLNSVTAESLAAYGQWQDH